MKLDLQFFLILIAILLFMIWIDVRQISARLRRRFPTAKEEDRDWAVNDPMGHWEAHKNDKKSPNDKLNVKNTE